ncbi:alpha/beta-hydrolase [Aureobasidium sp. EXF-3400]|nr:alpha/beta-hydrolase [Aureobasidium sp. EXF-12344]KAI4783508.1 alpha/beta-hydrolase [Aureobasidium sp. EXF-3400]
MPIHKVQGADLHYDTFGTGPPLLLITGAGGNGSAWHAAAQFLSKHYTTICYDRRNYSSSTISGSQDYNNRLAADASDAATLIAHISPSGKALVLGNSSGAIVGLHLLLNHPSTVELLIAHEPPAFGALPPDLRSKGEEVINHIYSQYRLHGPIFAMQVFTSGLDTGNEGESMRQIMHPSHSHESRANALFWFEFELRQYPCADLDMEGLVKLKEKLIPAAGIDSGMGVGVAPITSIAAAIGKDVLRLPGGHIGYVTQPEAWSRALVEKLGNIFK